MTRTIVKAIHTDGSSAYYPSLTECCQDYGIRYEKMLLQLIENGGLAPDGKTFFDYPTDEEMKEIRRGEITLIYNAARRRRENGIQNHTD